MDPSIAEMMAQMGVLRVDSAQPATTSSRWRGYASGAGKRRQRPCSILYDNSQGPTGIRTLGTTWQTRSIHTDLQNPGQKQPRYPPAWQRQRMKLTP
jgi:hypothetical protein